MKKLLDFPVNLTEVNVMSWKVVKSAVSSNMVIKLYYCKNTFEVGPKPKNPKNMTNVSTPGGVEI